MSVTAAKGFTAARTAAGIKQSGGPDLPRVVNNGPGRAAAGVYDDWVKKSYTALAAMKPGRFARIESLDGAGREISGNLLAARRHGVRLDRPEDLIAVPGIGARLLHAWHADLVFPSEVP